MNLDVRSFGWLDVISHRKQEIIHGKLKDVSVCVCVCESLGASSLRQLLDRQTVEEASHLGAPRAMLSRTYQYGWQYHDAWICDRHELDQGDEA